MGVISLVACPERTAVWIEPGATANHLVFRVGARRGSSTPIEIGVLRVDRCGDDGSAATSTGFWVIDGTGPVSQVTYAEVPSGFTEVRTPLHVPGLQVTASEEVVGNPRASTQVRKPVTSQAERASMQQLLDAIRADLEARPAADSGAKRDSVGP